MSDKLSDLLFADLLKINNILFDTAEAGDIEHYINCHADQLPEIIRRFSKKIEEAHDICAARLLQYWDAKAKCRTSEGESLASLPQDDLPDDAWVPEMTEEERAAFIKEINEV